MKQILIILELTVSILIIMLITLQAKGTGLGSSIGGFGGGEFYSSKRGVEKIIFVATVVLIVLFSILSISLLLV